MKVLSQSKQAELTSSIYAFLNLKKRDTKIPEMTKECIIKILDTFYSKLHT